jgi:hypothetical protein
MKTAKAVFGTLAITLALTVQAQAQSFPTNGLIAYYPFNGSANDESGNGNNGVVSGATLTQDQFGRSGMAYAFNGSNSLITFNIPNIPTGAAPRSLSLWAAANPIPSTGECLACWGAGQYGQAFSIEANGSPLTWWGGLFGPPPADDLNSGVIVDTNWHQLVFVYDGTNASIAVDGVQKAIASRSPDTAFSAFIVGVGVGPEGLSGFFSGSIDDVRIYNRALSTNEVAQLYAIESTPPQSFLTNGLIAYYPLTTDGTDQSGHGLNLTLTNVVFSTVGSAGDMRPAACFDGESSYAIVNQALIADQTNWTWAAWLYSPQGATESSNEQWIYMEGLQSGPYFGIIINDINEPGTLGIAAWNASLSGNWMHFYLPNVLTNGWSHLVFTLANGNVGTGTLSIFLNGVLTNSSLFQSVVPQGTSPIGVIGNGWLHSWLTAPWKGSMADLRFYNRALSSNEVQQLYAYESVPPPGFQTNGLVAYYPLNGNANDASGNGYNGTVNGATPTQDHLLRPGSAYWLNGTNAYIYFGPVLPDMQAITVAAWVKSDGGSTFFCDADWTPDNDFTLVLGTSNTIVKCSKPPGPSNYSADIPLTIGIGGAWWHIAWVVTTNSISVYIDGVLNASAANYGGVDVGYHDFIIGTQEYPQYDFGWLGYWEGGVSELRIYNRALSVSEVQELYLYESGNCLPYDATATAQVVDGFVVAATITDAGCGYTNTPGVRIIGGGGSGAQAAAVVTNGVVIAVNVLNAGSGYTDTPVVVIAPPFIPQPTMGISALLFGPLVTPVMELDLSNLSPYDNYQLQFTPVAGGTWTNLGAPFTPTAVTSIQYIEALGGAGFFRVKHVP